MHARPAEYDRPVGRVVPGRRSSAGVFESAVGASVAETLEMSVLPPPFGGLVRPLDTAIGR